MKNFSTLWTAFWRDREVPGLGALIIAVLIGFADVSYLAIQELSGAGYHCDARGFNCALVLTSRYAKFLGIPWIAWGIAYYTGMLVLTLLYAARRKAWMIRLIGLGVSAGIVVSAALVFVQAAALRAWCLYCVVSEGAVALIALSFGFILVSRKK